MSNGMLSFEDALERLLAGAHAVAESERIPTQAALGRVLAQAVHSAHDVPPLDNSSMDGYALRCVDVPGPGTQLAVAQRIPAGAVGHALAAGTAARIFTGAPLPDGADAVVMQELCALDHGMLVVNHVPRSGEWIRRRGEDIAVGKEVLPAGTLLRPQELGVAASVGEAQLTVWRRVKVALFSTGNELTMPGDQLQPGGIYNSNRYTLNALLQGLGCEVSDFGIVPDRLDATRAMLREAAIDHDLIITSGGVSVGEEDHVKPAVEAEGSLDLWKIAMKPGKPLAFGSVRKQPRTDSMPRDNKDASMAHDAAPANAAFIGLPGNPVSSFVTFLMLVRPFIRRLQGATDSPPRRQMLRAEASVPGDPRREFLRARINDNGGVELFPNQSAGVLTSCVWGDGLVDNPAGHAIAAGELVRFIPFSELL